MSPGPCQSSIDCPVPPSHVRLPPGLIHVRLKAGELPAVHKLCGATPETERQTGKSRGA